MREKIASLVKTRAVILDGAWGTELQKRGMPTGVTPELWCLESQDIVAGIHRDYAAAGADVVYSCTFGANRGKLPQHSAQKIVSINRDLVQVARQAVGQDVLVAGDIGPTGRFVEPFGDLPFEDAVKIFKEQAKGLIAGGADLLVVETMIDIQEARAALLAIKEISAIFTVVTMTFEPNGRTLGGTDPVSALVTLQSLGADAVGCNCSLGPDGMVALIAKMKPVAKVPLVAKPNAGLPRLRRGETVFDMPPAAFASHAKKLLHVGANLLGGCCGTTPAHIKAASGRLRGLTPSAVTVLNTPNLLSSPRASVEIAPKGRLIVIGERLNPTGKKELQEDMRSGKFTRVRALALEQEWQGADLLDVNVGVPDVDEVEAMRRVVGILATSSGRPLIIDSGNPQAIATALRLYPGRAMINSISGEKEKLKTLPALAKKYGAMFIVLPLTDEGLPRTHQERLKVIGVILKALQRVGLNRDDAVVDGLALSVATDTAAGEETLKTIRHCTEELQIRTVLGVSNASFGMPSRGLLNATLLTLARQAGLMLAIVNPASAEIRGAVAATNLLLGFDRDARDFLHLFAEKQGVGNVAMPAGESSPAVRVKEAVLDGAREEVVAAIEEALAAGVTATALMEEAMIPGIVEVGVRYEKRRYFLPQLVASAEAMKRGMDFLTNILAQEEEGKPRETILLATVEGDVHDIGKNIVALLLRNHGYRVVDLGKDCPAERIIAAMEKEKPALVGLSALMTTTMVRMPEVINLARQKGLTAGFVVGGAVLTSDYARAIGAHYAHDALAAVKLAKQLT